MKTWHLFAALLAAGAVACSEKPPPASPPKPKVEAEKPTQASTAALQENRRGRSSFRAGKPQTWFVGDTHRDFRVAHPRATRKS